MGSKPSIQFHSSLKVFRAQLAVFWPGRRSKGPAHAYGIAEFKRRMPNVLFGNKVLRDGPPADMAAEDQFCFELPFFFLPVNCVLAGQIVFAVVPDYLQQAAIGSIDVFKFHIEDRIDPVFSCEYTETVLPAEARKQRAVV